MTVGNREEEMKALNSLAGEMGQSENPYTPHLLEDMQVRCCSPLVLGTLRWVLLLYVGSCCTLLVPVPVSLKYR